MKITCDRAQMLAAFTIAASVAPSRSPKAVLQGVKIDVGPDGAVLTATDMELGVRVEVPGVVVDVPGSALLPVQRFGSLLRENADARLRITADQQGITVKGERSSWKMPGGNPDEFPSLPPGREDRCTIVSSRLFHELVRRTLFATETESSRYALGGVLLEFTNEKITAVGTDGRRLAKMEGLATTVGDHHSNDTTTIVPSRAMQLMDRGLTDSEGEVISFVDELHTVIGAGAAKQLQRLGVFAHIDADFLQDRVGIVLEQRQPLIAQHAVLGNLAHDVGHEARGARGARGREAPRRRHADLQRYPSRTL